MHAEAMTINNVFTILDIAKQTNECTVQYKVDKITIKIRTECVSSLKKQQQKLQLQ